MKETVKDDRDSCSTASSISGIYKNMMNKSPTPICMFYFSHPFGISTPASANKNAANVGGGEKTSTKKGSKYTTKTYLVTEIQKNHSDGSQDEVEVKKHPYTDRELIPWPKNFLLPPLIQLLEKKQGRKLPDIDAILKQVRKQAWNTPKSHRSHNFWSRGSSISSDDFSSLASPDSLNDKAKRSRVKLRHRSKNSKPDNMEGTKLNSSGSNGSSRGKTQMLLKRRYSVPEIIMRKYSLAQQKSYEESTGINSTASPMSEAITKSRNGQSSINSKKLTPSQPVSSSNTRTSSPIKYFIPLSPQPQSAMTSASGYGGSGSFLHNETSMRKQTLLRRMWSREFQHSKYSGSWSPPLKRSTHQQQNRLQKFNTLPEVISSSCEKCKELGVLARNFDEEFGEAKEDKSQQTDFDSQRDSDKVAKNCYTSPSSGASTIVHSADVNARRCTVDKSSIAQSTVDSNGNNIIICMTALQDQMLPHPHLRDDDDETLQVEIDGNNNSNMTGSGEKFLRKQFSTQIDDVETADGNYQPRLRVDNVKEAEIDEYISKMLIENLNTVIKTVNENLQANGEHNLVKIDYGAAVEESGEGSEKESSGCYNNKFGNQHEISIQMRNAKNGDTVAGARISKQPESPTTPAVVRETRGNADGKLVNESPESNLNQHFYGYYGDKHHLSDQSESTDNSEQQLEVTAIISSGTSYPSVSHPESIFIPRLIGLKTESMEVNPSSSSTQEDDEFDGMGDSDDEDLSDVDSLDDIVSIRARKLSELAHHQHRKAQQLFKQTHLKGQAFFVPIVDSEQPIDEHIVVADTMPEKLKEKLILRQRRRDMKKQSDIKVKQWRMQKFIERKMGEVKLVNNYIEDFSTGGAFKIIGMPKKLGPIETNVYKREPGQTGGWMSKSRQAPAQAPMAAATDPVSGKAGKSKKLRSEIGMLESYKIDGRGNMQIQNPGKAEKPVPKPKVKRTVLTAVSENKKPIKTKSKTPSEMPSRKSHPSSKRATVAASNIPTSSASSIEASIDARRRQVMKDVQQMSIYKNDLTPDPDSGPSRKMWKTEIQEGDKHIEILEIVECVDGTSSSSQHQQMAPEHNTFSHLFPPSSNSTQNHNYYHVSSSSTHPTIVNKTFSVRTSGYGPVVDVRDNFQSRIPIPVYRYMRTKQPFVRYEPRDSSPSNNNYSSSTDAEESSAESLCNKQPSKVDRMIANLLMDALQSPDDLGIEFVKSPKNRKPKKRSQSPAGADSSSTGYYTGDSSSRRSASNSAGKYQHRFEVIPEEKSSFSVDSSNDDFIEDEEEENAKCEKLNNINNDWKSRKNSQNNDIKTRSVTPKQEKEIVEDEREQSNNQPISSTQKVSPKKSPSKSNLKSPSPKKSTKASPVESSKSSGGDSSPEKSETAVSKPLTTFSEKLEQIIENEVTKSIEDESASQQQSEDAIHSHPEHTNLIHQFMSNKSSTSSSNNHFHYHLYQYQTHHCCLNLFDQSKSSSTVTTAASNENFSSFHTQSIENSCRTADFSQSRNTQHCDDDDKSKTATSSKFNENFSRLTTSESEFPSTIFHNQSKVNFEPSVGEETPSYDENASKSQTAEKLIKIEFSNDNYKPAEDDQDDCSCTKKYLPYKINEKNVWQVYETSDCKYIQSKYEIDEIFQPPPQTSSDGNKSSEYNPLLHSRSNFSNQIICHTLENVHETSHSGSNENAQETEKSESVNSSTPFNLGSNLNSAGDSLYMPMFNIKTEASESCHCIIDEETEDAESKVNSEKEDVVVTPQFTSTSQSSYQLKKQSGKLLNRPKATNNISRDQVKPVEKEIQNEITKNGVKASTIKSSKPIRLPSPVPKHQATIRNNKSYEDDSQLSESDFSSNESQQATVKENKKSPKTKSNQSSANDKENVRQQSSLMRQEGKSVVIPNIHQGWSVTVAGTHPDLAPDVEMKLSFPKAKGSSMSADNRLEGAKQQNPEVFYYRNNQLLPAPTSRDMPNQEMQYDRFDHKPYYNHRRSLSLARIDSGMSGMIKPKSYNLPNLHVPRPTARNAFKVDSTTISASKTIIPSRRSLSLDVGNRRLSLDSRSQASPCTPSEMLSVVGSEIKKTLKPKVKTMSERDLTKRHLNCFTRSNGNF